MDRMTTYVDAVQALRDHLHVVWMKPVGSDKEIDASIKDAYEMARDAIQVEETPIAHELQETGSYLIDCYERLVRGESVGGLAEAEGGFAYTTRKFQSSAGPGMAPA